MDRRLTVGSLIKGNALKIIEDTISENKKDPIKTTFIEVKQKGQLFKVTPVSNEVLLDRALSENIPLDFKCRKGTCGKCAVEIVKGANLLHPPNEKELKKCGDVNVRLACQTIIK